MRAALDTKEMLLARLATMNEEIEAGHHREKGNHRPVAFQKAYAQTLMDLQLVILLPKKQSSSLRFQYTDSQIQFLQTQILPLLH